MTFSEYLEDVLNLHEGLLSAAEIAEARASFVAFCAPKPVAKAHPDMKMSLADLRARCERLTQSQARAIEKFAGVAEYEAAVIAGRAAVALGRRILSEKRATKPEYIAHATLNSSASRAFNAVRI